MYIAGYGRSGSTVLDMLLGSNPHMASMSELTHIFRFWQENSECSCGKLFHDCEFWSRVFENVDATGAAKATRRVQGIPLWLSAIIARRQRKDFARAWRQLFEGIISVTGRPVVVDSSKSSRRCFWRPDAIRKLCHADVQTIHLVRDPRAVTYSYLRGDNRLLESGVKSVRRGSAYRVITSWLMSNSMVHLTHLFKSKKNYCRIRYEDLVTNPEEQLQRVIEQFDLQPVVGDFNQESADSPVETHAVAGNRVRRKGIQKLVLDDEWKTGLQGRPRRLSIVCWPLMKKYGY